MRDRWDATTGRAVRAAVAWLDKHQGTGREQQTVRILKLQEEAGEAARAWIGVIGHNPRRGISHTVDDVAAELADTAITALVAIESLGLDAEEVLAECASKVLSRLGDGEVPADLAGAVSGTRDSHGPSTAEHEGEDGGRDRPSGVVPLHPGPAGNDAEPG